MNERIQTGVPVVPVADLPAKEQNMVMNNCPSFGPEIKEEPANPTNIYRDKNEGILRAIDFRIKDHMMISLGVLFVVGLLLGSGLAAVLINPSGTKVNKTGDKNSYAMDTDGDGVSDEEERITYGTDPTNADDMMVRTGLLLCHNSLSNLFPLYQADDAVILSDNEVNNSEVIHAKYPYKSHSVVWGQFFLKTRSDGTWEIVKENLTGFESINTEADLPSSVSVVYDGMTLGYGIDNSAVWFSFEEKPTFFTSVKITGVKLEPSLVMRLGVFPDIAKNINIIQNLVHLPIDEATVPFVIADQVTFTGQVDVKGDILKTWNLNQQDLDLLAIDPTGSLSMAGYSLILMQEENEDTDFWTILTPSPEEDLDLGSVVTLHDVIPFDIGNLPGSGIFKIDLPTEGQLKAGIWNGEKVSSEDYQVSSVSSMNKMIQTDHQTGVSVECYVLWMELEDVLDSLEQSGGTDLSSLEEILSFMDIDGSAIGLMLDTNWPGKVNEETFLDSMGVAMSSDRFIDPTSNLLLCNLKGVVHDIGSDSLVGTPSPLLLLDEVYPYDTVITASIKDIDSNPNKYQASANNQVMVELEGSLFGTTVKTLVDQIDNNPDLSFLKVIQYFPYDVCLYQMFSLDEKDNGLYTLPVIQVVSGRGNTYLGETKLVTGWYDSKDARTDLTNLLTASLSTYSLPTFCKEYLISFLTTGKQGYNLTSFITDNIKDILSPTWLNILTDLNTDLIEDVADISPPADFFEGMFDEDISGFSESTQHDIQEIEDSIGTLVNDLKSMLDTMKGNITGVSSFENDIKARIASDLTFDEINDIIDNITSFLNPINTNLTSIKTHISNQNIQINNILSSVSNIITSAGKFGNFTKNLFDTMANQLKYLFNMIKTNIDPKTIAQNIINSIWALFPFPKPLIPPAPIGFPSFLDYICSFIKNGINITEAILFQNTQFTSFLDMVKKDPMFNFIDEIIANASAFLSQVMKVNNETKKLLDLKNIVNTIVNQAESALSKINNFIEDVIEDIEDKEFDVTSIKTMIENIIGNIEKLTTDISDIISDILNLKKSIDSFFTDFIENGFNLTQNLQKKITLKCDEALSTFTSDLKSTISTLINTTFSNQKDNEQNLEKYFEPILIQYVNDTISVFNKDFKNVICLKDPKIIKGFIIGYTLE